MVKERLCWSDALFYCRKFHSDLLSIRGPEEQAVIQQLVARAGIPLTSHLWVGLRRYSCHLPCLTVVSIKPTSLSALVVIHLTS